ncbi:MAG TPA: hypothetical protein VGK17_11095 [Propionicimonas sp.]|jgi:hypothetical protein
MTSTPTTAPELASVENVPQATPESTRASIVLHTGGGYTRVRHSFVQKHEGKNRGSTLGKLVKEKRRRALVLYLLLLTTHSDEPHPVWAANVWLRALEVRDKPNVTWSRSTLSEAWSELVRLKLVTRQREHRRSRVTPLREDRKGAYTRPNGSAPADYYLLLPGAFWTECWFDRLSLPALAVLLVLLKESGKDEEVHLTHAETARWYGFSEATAKKGYQELEAAGLVAFRDEWEKDDYAEFGRTRVRYYRLESPFSTPERTAARAEADKERRRRARRAGAATKGKAVKEPKGSPP